jgi:hypothetical protein
VRRRVVAAPSPGESKGSWLQVATQVAGLLAGLTAAVYATGAAVLSLRLAVADLPWGNVVSQLPREFLLTVGAGQVLLPSLLVGGMYALYRVLRNERPSVPRIPRWRDGWRARPKAIRGYLLAFLAMLLPLAAVLLVRRIANGEDPDLAPILVGCLTLPILAVAVQEARGVLTRHHRPMLRWNNISSIARMGAVYVLAAIPAMTVAAAAVPLSEAKVCTTEEFAEGSFLIGETSDRVYLGEFPSQEQSTRRIAVFPMAQVEELFIGEGAIHVLCSFERLAAGAQSKSLKRSGP